MRIPNPRLSRRGYVALTIAGILAPTLFLGVLGLHLVQRHYRFQNQILEEYGRFSVEYAASEIQRAIVAEERDIASYLQLVALVTGFRPEDELRRAEWTYPLIEHAFAREMDGKLVLAKHDSLPATASAASRARLAHIDSTRGRALRITRRTLDDTTVEHVLLSNEVHFYAGDDDGTAYQLVAFPYRDAMNSERGVMGFFLNVDYLRHDLVGRLLETSIHAAEGRFAPDFGKTLTLVVRDEHGHDVYTHHHAGVLPKHAKAACAKRDLSRSGLDDLLPGWTVGITYRDPKGFAWMRRIMTVQVGLLLLAAALAVAGTLVAMRFGLRQMELSRIKSHLVSNITHEIKTPLAAIRLYSETLQQGRVRDRAEADRFLGIIQKEVARLAALIDNILDFGRIEAGRRSYRFVAADVGNVVRGVVDAYAYQVRDKGFDLQLDIEPDLPLTEVDHDAVGQAVLNLLDNAVKYSRDSKEVRISVRKQAGANGGEGAVAHRFGHTSNGRGAVLVEVRDRGIGIPATEHRKIFDAFYRVEKGLEHDVKGSGLGLALVKHVAEAHGGSVKVESQPGAGSTFTLCLPIHAGAAPGGRVESSDSTPSGVAAAGVSTPSERMS